MPKIIAYAGKDRWPGQSCLIKLQNHPESILVSRGEDRLFRCPLCDEAFRLSNRLQKHAAHCAHKRPITRRLSIRIPPSPSTVPTRPRPQPLRSSEHEPSPDIPAVPLPVHDDHPTQSSNRHEPSLSPQPSIQASEDVIYLATVQRPLDDEETERMDAALIDVKLEPEDSSELEYIDYVPEPALEEQPHGESYCQSDSHCMGMAGFKADERIQGDGQIQAEKPNQVAALPAAERNQVEDDIFRPSRSQDEIPIPIESNNHAESRPAQHQVPDVPGITSVSETAHATSSSDGDRISPPRLSRSLPSPYPTPISATKQQPSPPLSVRHSSVPTSPLEFNTSAHYHHHDPHTAATSSSSHAHLRSHSSTFTSATRPTPSARSGPGPPVSPNHPDLIGFLTTLEEPLLHLFSTFVELGFTTHRRLDILCVTDPSHWERVQERVEKVATYADWLIVKDGLMVRADRVRAGKAST